MRRAISGSCRIVIEADFWNCLEDVSRCRFFEDYESKLFSTFTAGDAAQQAELRALIRNGSLPLPKERKNAITSNRWDLDRSDLTRPQKVERWLMWFAIRGRSDDSRDDLISIGCAHCGAEVIGLDVENLFEKHAALCEPEAATFLRKYLTRKPGDKSLKAWRLRVVQTPEGPWIEEIPWRLPAH